MTEFQTLLQWLRNCFLAGIPLAEANQCAGQPWRGMIDRLSREQAIAIAVEEAILCESLNLAAPADNPH